MHKSRADFTIERLPCCLAGRSPSTRRGSCTPTYIRRETPCCAPIPMTRCDQRSHHRLTEKLPWSPVPARGSVSACFADVSQPQNSPRPTQRPLNALPSFGSRSWAQTTFPTPPSASGAKDLYSIIKAGGCPAGFFPYGVYERPGRKWPTRTKPLIVRSHRTCCDCMEFAHYVPPP